MTINVLEYLEKGPLLKCRDKVAVIDHDRRLTFGQIERFAKNCAALILKQTSRVNRPIAVFLPKSAEAIIADLGILYTGNCYANLDIKSPPQRLKSMLQNLQARPDCHVGNPCSHPARCGCSRKSIAAVWNRH